MDFNKQVDQLQDHVEELRTSVAAAAKENHEQLKKRIDQAQADTDRTLAEANQQANAAAEKVQSSWEQSRSEAQARLDAFKAKAKHRAIFRSTRTSPRMTRGILAEATPTPSTTRTGPSRTPGVAILDAIDARVTADEKSASLV
jgi:hypothetical protein